MSLFQGKEPEKEQETDGQKRKWVQQLAAGLNTRAFRMGGYSLAAVAIVLVIAIAVNLLMGALPAALTQFDTSYNHLYNISSQTQKVIGELDTSVELYWITRSGKEDAYVEKVLTMYDEMSEHLTLTKKDPDVYPTFVPQYFDGTVYDNSVLVVWGEKYRYIQNSEIYVYNMDNYWATGQYDITFDAEGALTSAISYVTAEVLPKLYFLGGHGESEIPEAFMTAIKKQNYVTEELSLLSAGSVPADADGILVYNPRSDISPAEKDALSAYLSGGGSLFVITSPQEAEASGRSTLEALMKEYGIQTQAGVVVETNTGNYYYGNPVWLLPTLNTHTITEPLMSGYRVMLPTAQGLAVAEDAVGTLTITKLLTTTDASYSVIIDEDRKSYEKQDGDAEGPFALAIASEDSNTQAKVVCVSSAALLDETSDMYVSGGNQDFFLNTLGWMCEYEDSITIHPRSLDYMYLSMDSGEATTLITLVVGVIPVCYLLAGIVVAIRRKRK